MSAVSVAREGAPSGHGAGRNSGSSACPGCAGCIRPRTHSTMRRCWKTTLLHLSWNGSWGCDFQCLLMFKACSLLVFYFDIGRFLKVCYCLAIREGKSKRRINPIDANKCLKPLSSKNETAGELPRLYDSQFQDFLSFINLLPDCRSLTSLLEVYIQNYRISMFEEQADRLKSLC